MTIYDHSSMLLDEGSAMGRKEKHVDQLVLVWGCWIGETYMCLQ